MATNERLQKVLARAGLGSRRTIEAWIEAGRIEVDGHTAQLGARVEPGAKVCVDGRPVNLPVERRRPRVLLYHKPEGEICSREDPAGRPTVFDRLPPLRGQRWVSVGRLDLNSQGLLLFTDDGELANRLMHPSSGLLREYTCRVRGRLDASTLERLRRGVMLDGRNARFESIVALGGNASNRWFQVEIAEGRYREVRRLWQAVGGQVSRLIRTRYGDVALPRNLPAGHWIELSRAEIDRLVQQTQL